MNLFINKTHIHFYNENRDSFLSLPSRSFDLKRELLQYNWLSGELQLDHMDNDEALKILSFLAEGRLQDLQFLSAHLPDLKEFKELIKKKFKIIKAGGGLVRQDSSFLMIYRLSKWDLPKGKMDEGEKFKETAEREVEEECNIKVKVLDKICTTWHHYTQGKQHILKQTRWYEMLCKDDSHMKPQLEEDIMDIRWMNREEVEKSLQNTYPAIRHVFASYQA